MRTSNSNAAGAADIPRQMVAIVAFLVMIVVNGLANALPINGRTTAQVSDSFDVLFVPAGYVFSIWGLIYAALLAFTIYQALPTNRENPALRRIGWLFVISCAANSAWVFLWHYELFPLTLLVMLALLTTLVAIYLRLDIERARVSTIERWLVQIPFSIYLGWITVATIANATDLLSWLGWDGWGLGAETWVVIMLAAATSIALLVALTRRDVAFLLVLVWAFAGIMVKQSATPSVAITAGVAASLLAIVALLSFYFHRPVKPPFRGTKDEGRRC
jgi:hypothetical protein